MEGALRQMIGGGNQRPGGGGDQPLVDNAGMWVSMFRFRQLIDCRVCVYLVAGSPEDAQTRSCWGSDGSYGTYARRIR